MYEKENFSHSFLQHIFDSVHFFLQQKIAWPGEWNVKNYTSDNRRDF